MRTKPIATAILTFTAFAAMAQNASFKIVSSSQKTLTESALKAAGAKSAGSVNGKSVSINGSGWLVVRTGPASDMMSYRIKGVRNPNLTVKHGGTMRILFVNTDDDMFHNIRFTAKRPPFETKINTASTVGSADLPHKTEKSYSAQQLVVKAPAAPGTYTYICTIPGHAVGGMYGVLTVK